MIPSKANRKFLLGNLIPASIFLYTMRPIRDDWSNFSNLRNIPFNFSGLANIATNEWCCTHEKRFFFISWLIQWPMAHLGNLAFVAVYLLCAFILLRLNWNVYQILINLKVNINLAIVVSGMLGWSAGSVIIGGWANNIFFTLPLVFLSELIRNLWFNAKINPVKLAILVFLCEFSGESSLGLLGVTLLIYLLLKYKAKENLLTPTYLLGQYVVSALINYFLTSGPKSMNQQLDINIFRNYFDGLQYQHLRLWDISSPAYGIESRNSTIFWTFILLMILNLILLIWNKEESVTETSVKQISSLKFLLVGIIFWIAIFVPMILGVISGSRTGPDYRYHLPLFIGVIATASLIYLKIDYSRKLSLMLISFFVAITFAASLEVRVRMHSLDDQIWKKVESNVNYRKLDGFVTYNPHTNYPMPPYHSFAESDFQADWGIAGKYYWLNNRRIPVYSNLVCNSTTNCTAFDYSGNEFDISNIGEKHFVYIYTNTKIDESKLNFEKIQVSSDYRLFTEFTKKYPKILS